ncbi:MAG: hypothetical protein U5K31_06875 [Balneolaceae bacterium]|nr:hypothetical protein [Balneolaceae bacterium]
MDVSPDGELIVAGGKLSTVHPGALLQQDDRGHRDEDCEGEEEGIPVLRYDATVAG